MQAGSVKAGELWNPNSQGAPSPLLARAIGSIGAAVVLTDERGHVVWVNDAFTRLTGYGAEDIVGVLPIVREATRADPATWSTLIEGGGTCGGEMIYRHKDGTVYVVDEIVTPLLDDAGNLTHYIVVQHDVTQSKKIHEQALHRANHDVLTGLATRTHLFALQKAALARAGESRTILATLFLDLDGFKAINDSHGHHVGDALLKLVAGRLLGAVRGSDTVARFGGDEFVILLPSIAHRRVAIRLGRKILAQLAHPFTIGSDQHFLSGSIGIAFYPEHGATGEALLINADQAMYHAKRLGGNRSQLVSANGAAAPGAG